MLACQQSSISRRKRVKITVPTRPNARPTPHIALAQQSNADRHHQNTAEKRDFIEGGSLTDNVFRLGFLF